MDVSQFLEQGTLIWQHQIEGNARLSQNPQQRWENACFGKCIKRNVCRSKKVFRPV